MEYRLARFRKRSSPSRKSLKLIGLATRTAVWRSIGFIVISTTSVVTLRWLDPPITAIQLQRQWQSDDWNPQHQWVAWNKISPSLALSVIAAEDQRFLQHHGFDTVEIRKAIAASQRCEPLRGASTLTQQTAKNVFLWNSRSFIRKSLEAWFAVLIELFWSKRRILEVYLNSVEFGPQIFGVEAACQHYFSQSAQNINASQAALLAAVLPNPHRMHVGKPSTYVRERQAWIERQMQQLGNPNLLEKIR